MATSQLQILINAVDNASSTLSSIGANATKMGIAMTAAGSVILGVLATTVKAASDNQTALAGMNATLTAMGKNTPAVSGAIQKAADATTNLGFSNDDALASITKFYQRTGDLTDALKLNQTAMDLARAKNIDLGSATNLVNLALSGSGRALLQYGIVIKDAATPMQALAELQGQINGQAAAFAATPQGQWDVLQAKVQLLQQTLGTQLLPYLADVEQAIVLVISRVQAWTDAHPQLTKTILLVAAAIGIFLVLAGSVLTLIGGLIIAFGSFGAIVTALVVGAIAALIAAAVAVIANWTAVETWFEGFFTRLSGGWQAFINNIVSYFGPLLNVINTVIDDLNSIASHVAGGNTGGPSIDRKSVV